MERVYTTPLLDKLGVRPGMRVALIDVEDETIRPLLADRTTDLTDGWPSPTPTSSSSAPIRRRAERPGGLATPHPAKRRDLGGLAQGQGGDLRDVDVIDAAKGVGLVDNKVAVVLGDAHRVATRDPGRAPAALTTGAWGTIAACRTSC